MNERRDATWSMEETRRLLGGEWAVVDSQAKLWTMKEKRQLLVFVSSTFTDTHLERDILMEKIFPRLQGEAMKYDVSVAISDMRYGVRDENTKDHKAWLYCKRELERCFHHSSGLFFLSLQGDKYGSRPLPRSIDSGVMNARLDEWLKHIQEQGSTADEYLEYWQYFHRWYELDENAIPAEFVLRELHSVNDSSFWQDVVPTLRKALMDLPCDRDCPDIRVGQSVTEWETRYALHLMKRHSHSTAIESTTSEAPVVAIEERQKNRMLWLHRHFESGIASTDDVSGLLADQHLDPDVATKLSELLHVLRDHLGHETEVFSTDAEPSERERAFSASAAPPSRGLSSSVSTSLSSRGGRPLLLRCASSSEYLDVIHQRQLLKQQSIGSHGSGSQYPQQSFGRFPPLPMSRQSSIQYSDSTDDIQNRSRSSTTFSLAGLAISRQVSMGGDVSADQQPPHLELPWQSSVDAAALTTTTPASTTTALQQYLSSWEQVTYDALHQELLRIAMESSSHSDSSSTSSASAAPTADHRGGDDETQHHVTLNNGFDSTTKLREMLHHCHWAMEKVTTFIGREVLQQKILDQLQAFTNIVAPTSGVGPNRKKPQASPGKPTKTAISLVLVGESGCGKTALMARMAQLLYTLEEEQWLASSSTYHRRPVIIRFCGTSSASTNALALMQSIIHQVTYLNDIDMASLDVLSSSSSSSTRNAVAGTDTVDTASGDSLYHQTVQQFHRLLAKYPVLLLLDSLDQLSDDYEARSELSFLKGLTVVHPRTRIIVSTLPDEAVSTTFNRPSQTLKRYAYQCDSRLQEWHVPRIVVRPFGAFVDDDDTDDDADGAPMLLSSLAVAREVTRSISQESEPEYGLIVRHILTKQYGRTLTPMQWTYLLHQAAEEPTALYLQLACRVISSWSSFPPNNPTATSLFMELSGGVIHVIHQVMDILEYTYGQALVRMVLGYITTALSGIRDSEMCDLLSLDDGVMHEVFQYALTHTPTMTETMDPWEGSLSGATSTVSVKRVPYHVWTRVRLALEGLLVEKEDGGLRWYHRQLQEVSEARFGVTFLRRHSSNNEFWRRSEDVVATGIRYWHHHAWLARYFGNIVPSDRRLHRLIASQPLLYATTHETISLNTLWHLSAQTVQGNRAKINIRRLREASHHISRAIHWQVQCLIHYLHRRSTDVSNGTSSSSSSSMVWPVAHCPWFSAAEMVQLVTGIASLEYVCAIMILDKQGVALTALLHDWEMIARAWTTLWDQLIAMRVWGNEAAATNNENSDGTMPLDYQGRVCVEDMRTLFTYSYLDVALGDATTAVPLFLSSRLDSRRFTTNATRGAMPDYDRQASSSTIATTTTTSADTLAVHPQNVVKRLQDYIAWLQANMSLIVQDPSSQILYTASRYTAHASSMVHQDSVFLRQIQGQTLPVASVSVRASGGGVIGITGMSLSRQTSTSISPRPSLSRTLTPNLGLPGPLSMTSLSRGTSLDSGHGTASVPASASGAGGVVSPLVYAPIPSKSHTAPVHAFGAPSSASNTPFSLARTPGSRRGSHATPRVASLQQHQHQHQQHHRNQAQPAQSSAHRHYQLLEMLYGVRPSLVPPAASLTSPLSADNRNNALVMQWLPLAPRWHTRPPTLFGHRNGVRHVYPVPSLRSMGVLGHIGPLPSTSLVSHCWQEIKLWNLRANMCTRTLHPTRVNSMTKQEISCLTLTPSGDHVVVCMTPANTTSWSIAQIWHLWTGHCLSVRRIELPAGAHAVVSSSTPSTRSGNHITVPDHREVVACICTNDFEQAATTLPSSWSPGSSSGMESSEDDDQDGYGAYVLLTAAKDRSICVWWVPGGEVTQPWVLLQVIAMAHRQEITRLMVLPAATSSSASTGHRSSSHDAPHVTGLVWISASADATVKIWRLSLSTRLLEILGSDHRSSSLSPKSKQLGSIATVLASVPVQTLCLATLVGHKAPVSALAYYHRFDQTDTDRLDGRNQSEDVDDGNEDDANSAIGSDDDDSDNNSDDDDDVEMDQLPTVDSDSDEEEADIGGGSSMDRRLGSRSMDDHAASVEGSWLASAAGNLIKLWPLNEDFLRHRRRSSSEASRNSHRRDKKATSLPCLATLTGHQSTIAALQVLPPSSFGTLDTSPLLLSAGREDCSIRLWQLVSRRFTCVYSWSPHRVTLTDLVLTCSPFSARSRLHESLRNTDPFHDEDEVEGMNTDEDTTIRLVSCSVDKTLRVWDTHPILTSLSSSSSSSSSLWTPAPSTSSSTMGANAARTSSLPTPPPSSSSVVPPPTTSTAATESDDEHRGTVTCVTVSLNGHFLLSAAMFTTSTGSTGHVIRLWGTHSQQVLHSYEEPHAGEEASLDRDRDDLHGGVHVTFLRFVEYVDTSAQIYQRRAAVNSIDAAYERSRSASRETAAAAAAAEPVPMTCPQYFVSMSKHNRGRFKLWSTSRRRDFQCLAVVAASDMSNPLVDVLLLHRNVCLTVSCNGHVKAWSLELLRKVTRDGKGHQRMTGSANDARGTSSSGSGKSSRSTGGGGGGGTDTNGSSSKGSRKGGSSSTSSKKGNPQQHQQQQSQRSRGGRDEPSGDIDTSMGVDSDDDRWQSACCLWEFIAPSGTASASDDRSESMSTVVASVTLVVLPSTGTESRSSSKHNASALEEVDGDVDEDVDAEVNDDDNDDEGQDDDSDEWANGDHKPIDIASIRSRLMRHCQRQCLVVAHDTVKAGAPVTIGLHHVVTGHCYGHLTTRESVTSPAPTRGSRPSSQRSPVMNATTTSTTTTRHVPPSRRLAELTSHQEVHLVHSLPPTSSSVSRALSSQGHVQAVHAVVVDSLPTASSTTTCRLSVMAVGMLRTSDAATTITETILSGDTAVGQVIWLWKDIEVNLPPLDTTTGSSINAASTSTASSSSEKVRKKRERKSAAVASAADAKAKSDTPRGTAPTAVLHWQESLAIWRRRLPSSTTSVGSMMMMGNNPKTQWKKDFIRHVQWMTEPAAVAAALDSSRDMVTVHVAVTTAVGEVFLLGVTLPVGASSSSSLPSPLPSTATVMATTVVEQSLLAEGIHLRHRLLLPDDSVTTVHLPSSTSFVMKDGGMDSGRPCVYVGTRLGAILRGFTL